MDLLGAQAKLITDGLSEASHRHRILAANIANVNTPGYKSKTLEFDEFLEKNIVKDREGVEPREDGNTVSMEREMADMRKNDLIYRMFLQSMLNKTRQLRKAISGRNG